MPLTVLLVEDNPDVRKLLARVLVQAGYVVLEASSGDAAVSLIEASAAPIDVLVADVVMPRMGGYELVQWARRAHPAIQAIYMSGHIENDVLELSRANSRAVFLQKPFSPMHLLKAVREATGRRGRTSGGSG